MPPIRSQESRQIINCKTGNQAITSSTTATKATPHKKEIKPLHAPDQITGTPHKKISTKPLRAITLAVSTRESPLVTPAVFNRRGRAGSLQPTWSHRQCSRVGCRRQFSTRESPLVSCRQSSPSAYPSCKGEAIRSVHERPGTLVLFDVSLGFLGN
jgi:hypothetical protein